MLMLTNVKQCYRLKCYQTFIFSSTLSMSYYLQSNFCFNLFCCKIAHENDINNLFLHALYLEKQSEAYREDNERQCFFFARFTFTFSHLADAFIQSDLQLGVHKAINLEEANIQS